MTHNRNDTFKDASYILESVSSVKSRYIDFLKNAKKDNNSERVKIFIDFLVSKIKETGPEVPDSNQVNCEKAPWFQYLPDTNELELKTKSIQNFNDVLTTTVDLYQSIINFYNKAEDMIKSSQYSELLEQYKNNEEHALKKIVTDAYEFQNS